MAAAKDQRTPPAKTRPQDEVDREAIRIGKELHADMMRGGYRFVFGDGER